MKTRIEFARKILSQSDDPDFFELYKSALEWDLVEPIIIEGPNDVKSEQTWRETLTPYNHQVTNLLTFCRRLPVTLIADDVGLGKTISAGMIISELAIRSRVAKVLIVCPKLLGPQWKEELESKFGIPAQVVTGRDLIKANPKSSGAVITTYHSARLYLDDIPEDRFEMLILDEAHKLRNLYGTGQPPQVALKFREALEDRRFQYVLMLTATPIQNRLWDLYSLVDLLTVARGHENPFGSEGMFVRKFIADGRNEARRLKLEAQDSFRSIVYGYMSRVRRADAKLYFPERVVQMHKVRPSQAELDIIEALSEPIQELNRLAQISILQALVSSPDALNAQLKNMARNGTVQPSLSQAVDAIVKRMPLSAKLDGLRSLIQTLKAENPTGWRLVVFTTRRETQTTIQAFLEEQGLSVGLINGDSGERNQEVVRGLRADPPKYRVIVSTEAGSEGVNLQAANVLVNFDLPWNPMVVEQRIGRVQRLASNHAKVSIFNIMLTGTFEEYIVGRLMEKLQLAAHAIGDIESLLQGADMANESDDAGDSFETQILELVLSALSGKDVAKDAELKARSIELAKERLDQEEEAINSMLGRMDENARVGPRAPQLPTVEHSMNAVDFVLAALRNQGMDAQRENEAILSVRSEDGQVQKYAIDRNADLSGDIELLAPGSSQFRRLVDRLTASGVYTVSDLDAAPEKVMRDTMNSWVAEFNAKAISVEAESVATCFDGDALLRVRATVAHDSYERLLTIKCQGNEHRNISDGRALKPIDRVLNDPQVIGLERARLVSAIGRDRGLAEFCRFYLERGVEEVKSAGEDERKKQKLTDDFTPRLTVTVVGVSGDVSREVDANVRYSLAGGGNYKSTVKVRPRDGKVLLAPNLQVCEVSGSLAPEDCFNICDVTGKRALEHLMRVSQISQRTALSEHFVECSFSGKRALIEETEKSGLSGQVIASKFAVQSALSGVRGEPNFFSECEFTGEIVLQEELSKSEVSGKQYRKDEQLVSAFSGTVGHKSEFKECFETSAPITAEEAIRCEESGELVRPDRVEQCSESGKVVRASLLHECSVSNAKALNEYVVESSVSQRPLLRKLGTKSILGEYCRPDETEKCSWSGRLSHPSDISICELTGTRVHATNISEKPYKALEPLMQALTAERKVADLTEDWPEFQKMFESRLRKGKVEIESATASSGNNVVVVCAAHKTAFGMLTRYIGAVLDRDEGKLTGRVPSGKRKANSWIQMDE
ncbi:MAG: SNF2-related protein [Pseudomonadota bacterium]